MAYLKSENVVVFPVAKERKEGIAETRLLTEHNLSNIIRQLLARENPGFISSTSSDSDGNFNVKFNLYGYQFDVDIENAWLQEVNLNSGNDGLYAYIIIDKIIGQLSNNSGIVNYSEIVGQDIDGHYQGLSITNNISNINEIKAGLSENEELAYIKILNMNNGVLSPVLNASFLSYAIGGIDGKYK